MSEPTLISPLLDGYVMGDPISNHDGVRCCPAMHRESEQKFIVKIISIPASREKLDALLLAGAFSDAASALPYFKDLADGIVEEAELLQKLQRLEGFLAFEGWQVVPMEDETGYDVYLLGSYRPSLERHFKHSPMTHLGAVNLGLDLCAALAICRRCGYLYVDLKPGNVYICDDHEYRIGDLGFIRLDSLQYASLPDKYRSAYTAPEITDAYSCLNTTLDIYAAGLILYQAYNNGDLPFEGSAPGEVLPPPAYADYEMAEIILKACAPDPADRWKNPLEMGQALVSYMQRNGANDTPIVPPVVPEEPEEPEEIEETEEVEESEEIPESPEEESAEENVTEEAEEFPEDEEPNLEQFMTGIEDALGLEHYEEPQEKPEEEPEEKSIEEDKPQKTKISLEDVLPAEDLQIITQILADETLPSDENTADLEDTVLTEEASIMLAQAEDLIDHEIPEPVVAPAPIDVPVPPLPEEAQAWEEATEEDAPAEEPNEESPDETSEEESVEEVSEEAVAEDAEEPVVVSEEGWRDPADAWADPYIQEQKQKSNRMLRNMLVALVAILMALLMFIGGLLFYEHYYLQDIQDLVLTGQEDQLHVYVLSGIDDELMTVVCTDSYGNTFRQKVRNDQAVFTELNPGTRYRVYVEISGLHKLTGVTSEYYTTPAMTNILTFTTVTGAEDGSVILNFTVHGNDSQEWMVYYSSENELERSVRFSGHMVAISDLTIGERYTFRLEPVSELYIVGSNTVEYTASGIIYAEDLTLESFTNGALHATWNIPEGADVDSWTVRCYTNDGFEEVCTVPSNSVTFTGLDHKKAYTVEVIANGMTIGVRAFVSANSVTVSDLEVQNNGKNQLHVSWSFSGEEPEGGWHLLYTIDGSDEQHLVYCAGTLAIIRNPLPGAQYSIIVQPADGTTALSNQITFETSEAALFEGYGLLAEDIDTSICATPDENGWVYEDLVFDGPFAPGIGLSLFMELPVQPAASVDQIIVLTVVRNTDGIPVGCATQSHVWSSLWNGGCGMIEIGKLPSETGDYTLEVYFNGALLSINEFTLAEEIAE